jgi:hypothetical protein
MQKKKEEESAREKELNELFKVAISQPKVPLGMLTVFLCANNLWFFVQILQTIFIFFSLVSVQTIVGKLYVDCKSPRFNVDKH